MEQPNKRSGSHGAAAAGRQRQLQLVPSGCQSASNPRSSAATSHASPAQTAQRNPPRTSDPPAWARGRTGSRRRGRGERGGCPPPAPGPPRCRSGRSGTCGMDAGGDAQSCPFTIGAWCTADAWSTPGLARQGENGVPARLHSCRSAHTLTSMPSHASRPASCEVCRAAAPRGSAAHTCQTTTGRPGR